MHGSRRDLQHTLLSARPSRSRWHSGRSQPEVCPSKLAVHSGAGRTSRI